jgi:hypothetical protein
MTLKQKTVNAFSRALFDTELVMLRILLGISELFWSLLLFWPGDSFSQPYYSTISRYICETQLAIIFLVFALIQFFIIFTEKFHCKFSQGFAFLSAVLWCITIISVFISVYPPPSQIGGEIVLMFGAIWVWLRPIILYRGIKNARQQLQQWAYFE